MAALPDAAPSAETSLAHLPLMLTVPEAAAVLRLSRSAAYKLAQEWEDTNGQRGLPVVRFGSRMLVRRADLAAIVGVGPAA
jgi:excisionase family DNA binding protein